MELTNIEKFLAANQPKTFNPYESDHITIVGKDTNGISLIKKLKASGYVIKATQPNPMIAIPYYEVINEQIREYLLIYQSPDMTVDDYLDLRQRTEISKTSSLTNMAVGLDNKIAFNDGEYYFSGREINGYGSEFLQVYNNKYLYPQYLKR